MCPVYHLGRSNKRSGDRMRFVTFRVPCFLWVGKPESGPHRGFGFAADISEEGAGLYLDIKLAKATPVRLAFEDKEGSAHRGIVAWCRRYNMDQRFHGQSALDYRVGIEFFFESEADRQRYLIDFNELRKRATSLTGEYKF